ncbi:MAG TPA: MarR family transcriptional regulator [Ruminococcaceae bacterium]|jgi:DNA-binding MarR family transcriptional regulator|nr:MarR family transcriptional regulator [Oscillospiraceae bacterium]HBT91337.1 MarR family transcriptional regulator [Oscillospiraceae bacterium]
MEKKNQNEDEKICDLLLDVICEFYESDAKARTFGTGTALYHSEIHMLQCIGEHPGLHISGAARLMGVTRGAASQTVKRLERKRMLTKEQNPDDSKKVVVRLTEKGKTAVFHHKEAHEKYRAVVSGILSGTGEDRREFLAGFLMAFRKKMKERNADASPEEGESC